MAWCGWRDDRAALRVSSRHEIEKPDAGISNRIDAEWSRRTGNREACMRMHLDHITSIPCFSVPSGLQRAVLRVVSLLPSQSQSHPT